MTVQTEVLREGLVRLTTLGEPPSWFQRTRLRYALPTGRVLASERIRRPDGGRRGRVLLFHGFAQNRFSWHLSTRSFVCFLADRGFTVHNIELTGHGISRALGSPPALGFDQYVEDAVPLIEAIHAEDGGPLFVIGHSLGGGVCYAAAPRIAPLVSGVVGVAGLFGFGRGNPAMRTLCTAVHGLRHLLLPGQRLGVASAGLGWLITRLLTAVDDLFWQFPLAGWVPGSTSPEVLAERLQRGFDTTGLTIFLDMSRWAAEASFDARDGSDYAAAWTASRLPCLILAGDHDRLLPPADAIEAHQQSSSPDRTFRLFSPLRDEVHWGHLDIILGDLAPTHVWPEIADWMESRS